MMTSNPEALDQVVRRLWLAVSTGQPLPIYPHLSEEFYWSTLVHSKPFVSCYASEDGEESLIGPPRKNLSQTAREQCEIEKLITDGLEDPGPGQAVVVQGLVNAAQFNGKIGRVLPCSGPGAPKTAPSAGRVAVRLKSGQELSCKPENLRSAHSAPPVPPAARPPSPTGVLADLVRNDVKNGQYPPAMDRTQWLQCGMLSHRIKCSTCDYRSAEKYVPLKRTLPDSPVPVPEGVRLQCVDCLIRAAEAARVRPNPKDVEAFVDGHCMPVMKACLMLSGRPHTSWGGYGVAGSLY